MNENLKPSRYNHFIKCDNGAHLVFNALSCGLGEMNSDNYRYYLEFIADEHTKDKGDRDDLIGELVRAGILVPEDVSELDIMRAGHYHARFGNRGFGLTIIPTVNCNFRCDYCYENSALHSLSSREGSVMSDEVCENLIKLCKARVTERTGLSVIWYGGEPLMALEVIRKLTKAFDGLCNSIGAKYSAGMITNGYLLTSDCLDFLLSAKVGFIQVTIDGPQDIHDTRRPLRSGDGTYQSILGNLQNIKDSMPLRISIRINVDRRNSDCIPRLLADLKRRDLHCRHNISIYFGQTVRYSHSCPDIVSHCMGSDEFADFMVEGFKCAVDLGFKITSFPIPQVGSCSAVGVQSALIEPNGDVQTCWATVGNAAAAVGKLTPDGIQYNQNLTKWLGWTPFNTKCEDCNVLPLCMGGCPYKYLYKEEVMDADNNICVWWKYNLDDMLELASRAHRAGLLVVAR